MEVQDLPYVSDQTNSRERVVETVTVVVTTTFVDGQSVSPDPKCLVYLNPQCLPKPNRVRSA